LIGVKAEFARQYGARRGMNTLNQRVILRTSLSEWASQYLFRRLYQIGIRSVHGVPGDYILNGLDFIPRASLRWIGNVNELEAGELPSINRKKLIVLNGF
jgi:hypothetical protein